MPKRVLKGIVVSDKSDKTITVLVSRKVMHPVYKKYIKKSKKYSVHDKDNKFKNGEIVSIQENKPISKTILVTIALTWVLPYFGFVLSSFRPGDSIKRTSWWNSVVSGDFIREFTFENYTEILFAENLSRSFFNSFAVTIPSTIIPITIAAFAAYAFAFIDFKGKDIAFLFVVAMMIVPLQMSLIH